MNVVGHIKLDRKILEWEWYSDLNTCRLFIHLLLKANWKDGRFQGQDIPRGSFVTSYNTLADETGLSVRNVRTALEHLKSTGEVKITRHSKYSVISIKNYCLYQSNDTQTDNQLTVNRQSTDSQVTTIEEKKEVKNGRNNIFIAPTVEDVRVYRDEMGYKHIDPERFVDFYTSKGWMVGKTKMKDWKSAVRNWERQSKTPAEKKTVKKNSFNNFDQRDNSAVIAQLELRQMMGG